MYDMCKINSYLYKVHFGLLAVTDEIEIRIQEVGQGYMYTVISVLYD